jgi:hypothetical protein
MDLPDKIKIGPFTYKISIVEGLVDEDGDECFGLHSFADQTIYLLKGLPLAVLSSTLMHELLHAIWTTRALPKRPTEERVVENFEVGLLSLFQDNPELIDIIQKGLK